jgi:hypothetical protein
VLPESVLGLDGKKYPVKRNDLMDNDRPQNMKMDGDKDGGGKKPVEDSENKKNKLTSSIYQLSTPKMQAEIDDLVTFFVSLGGVDVCKFTYADSNAGGSETAVKAIARNWDQKFDYGDYYSLSVTLSRTYEP